VLGLYDPKTRTLFIGDFIPAAMLSMVVGHEIVHGLQDMHFDLEKHQKPLLHRGDAESARRFLIEGEAQAAYLAWVSGETGLAGIDDAVLDAMGNQTLELADEVSEYPILARSLQMPYADGTATVIRLVRTEGWDAVDAMYADLPQSTEQMLHIDKLKAREPAVAVELDAAPLAQVLGLTEIWYDDIGEAALLAMLADVEGALAARRAAAGWGGDRYVAFDRSGAKALPVPVVVAATVWDTVDDAKEFEVSFRKYLDQTIGKGVFIARRGDAVVFATGIPPEIEPASIEQVVWTSMRKGRPSK
jgi:hypothetical protein